MRKPIVTPAFRRCAIYTRKSSEEGLEQAFNSLDAQREACAAYIASQRHEGWGLLPEAYDDGGISGGTLERPALQRLLADIRAGKVDLVIVYKVDRLTRSLADFAKIVDVFDAQGASFVSVTQQFNTATSMGRLTLNMLLSFAQFEREVTGERIRDKIAASKRKGMWMGGVVPLGYEVRDRKLVINPAEAETVRHIYRLYLQLGSVHALQLQLAEEGVRSKSRPTAAAPRLRGGQPLMRGALYLMLQNRLYRGEVAHQGQIHPGEHEAIIDAALWEAVQARLADNRTEHHKGARATNPSLLTGLLRDSDANRFTPTHAVKNGRRYRYYLSNPPADGTAPASAPLRLPARDLEQAVLTCLTNYLARPVEWLAQLNALVPDGAAQKQLLDRAHHLKGQLQDPATLTRRAALMPWLTAIVATASQIEIHFTPSRLLAALTGDSPSPEPNGHEPPIILTVPVWLRRLGQEMRLLVEGGPDQRPPDPTLIRLIARARLWHDQLLQDGCTIAELAKRQAINSSYLTRVLRLAFLAPEVVTAILNGTQPVGVNAERLVRASRLPMSWREQGEVLERGLR